MQCLVYQQLKPSRSALASVDAKYQAPYTNDPFIKAPAVPPSESGRDPHISRPKLRQRQTIQEVFKVVLRMALTSTSTWAPSHQLLLDRRKQRHLTARMTAGWRRKEDTILVSCPERCLVGSMANLVIMDALMADLSRRKARSLLPALKRTVPVSGKNEEANIDGEKQRKGV